MTGNDLLLHALTAVAAVGCALIAGVFYAFSAFVMRALARLAPACGIAAMQSINLVVLNPWFLGVFLGTAAACAIAVVMAILRWGAPGAAQLLLGGSLYLIGTFAVTLACNVPRNEALAAADPQRPESVALWTRYLVEWTRWNHVRTAAALAALIVFLLALAG